MTRHTVPTLDAATAHEVVGFLYWTTIALMRLHSHWGPYTCFQDIQDAANMSRRYWERGSNVDEFKEIKQ